MISLPNSTSSPIPSSPAKESPIHTHGDSLDDTRSPFSFIEDEKKDSINIEINTKYLLDDGRTGVCVFIGTTFFGRGEWIGLVLDTTHHGNTNGIINNKHYFTCDSQQGLFVRRQKIIHKIQTDKAYDTKKIAVSFYHHEKGESTGINAVFSSTKDETDDDPLQESDDSVLSLEFEFNTPLSNTATPNDNNGVRGDDTPDTLRKLNQLFTSTLQNNDSEDKRRVSMMETMKNDTQIISALRPVRRRMRMYTRSESWTPINFKMKHNEDEKDDFLRPRLLYNISSGDKKSANINKKMGPIDIGRIEYNTPYGDYEEEIQKSPFYIDKYKGWYPKPSPKHKQRNRKSKGKPRRSKLKRSTSTIDTDWKRRKVIKSKKRSQHTHHLAWIEREYTLIRNPLFRGNVKEKNQYKKKKKKKAKSTKRIRKKRSHVTSRSGSGPLIKLQPKFVNDINIILEDSCTDVEEYAEELTQINGGTNRMLRSKSYDRNRINNSNNVIIDSKYSKTRSIKVEHYFL